MWFAGEHTAPFIALGTTTGAYWSGEGVARRIVRAYQALEDGEGRGELKGMARRKKKKKRKRKKKKGRKRNRCS